MNTNVRTHTIGIAFSLLSCFLRILDFSVTGLLALLQTSRDRSLSTTFQIFDYCTEISLYSSVWFQALESAWCWWARPLLCLFSFVAHLCGWLCVFFGNLLCFITEKNGVFETCWNAQETMAEWTWFALRLYLLDAQQIDSPHLSLVNAVHMSK